MISECTPADFESIFDVINDAAVAYRGAVPADCLTEPYMSREALRHEIDHDVAFSGFVEGDTLLGVMGLQHVADVSLIRHAYTRTTDQGRGIGGALLEHHQRQIGRPMLIGTWKAATWAIRFYEGRGFRLVDEPQKDMLLKRYWTVPARQAAESVVLVDARWLGLQTLNSEL